MAFLQGYLIGLGLIVLIGPVFFVLLQTTLQYGRWPGLTVAFGIFVSDIIAVALCVLGARAFFENQSNQKWIAWGGGLLLLAFGLKYLLKPTLPAMKEIKLSKLDYFGFFSKGFLINFVNPFVFLVWLGIIANAGKIYGYSQNLAFFLIGTLLAILTLDSLKALFADKLKGIMRPNVLKIIFRISGVLLILFAARLIFSGI